MAYRLPLLNLKKMTDEEFAAIESCDPCVVTEKFITKIKAGQAHFFELCRDISPALKDSLNRPSPRYIPIVSKKYRGGLAVIFDALDRWNFAENGQPLPVMLKIPWPEMRRDKHKQIQVTQSTTRIEKVALSSIDVAGRIYRKLVPPSRRKTDKQETEPLEARESKDERAVREQIEKLSKESLDYEFFHREYLFLKQMHQRARLVDKGQRYGYVPEAFDFGPDRNPYISMEIIEGTPHMDWVREHNDQENLDLFLRVITFVRICFHDAGLAHCDLKPDNIIVRDGLPVFLDFGTAKAEFLPTITLPNTQKGTPDTASTTMLEDAALRSYPDDIFALGRLLWKTVNRRNPPTEYALAKEDADGKLHFDKDFIQSLFDDASVPEKFRACYNRTWQYQYEKLEDFQRDLEEALYMKPINTGCVKPCERIFRLEKKFEELIKIWSQE